MSASIDSLSVDQAGGVTATLIPAKSGYRIQVLAFVLSVSGAASSVKSTLQDETSNTVRMTLVGNATAPAVYSFSGSKESPAFKTAKDQGLELITGVASAISGFLNYEYVPG